MPALAPSALRLAIQSLIQSVPNTGQVHTYRRIIRDENQLKAYLWDATNSRLCGWFISPAPSNFAQPVRHPGYQGLGQKGGGNVLTTFAFQIEGMFGLDDLQTSETVFTDLVWAVADEFDAYGVIPAASGGAVPGLLEQLACQVQQVGYINFVGVALMHYARMEIGFRGRTRPSP